MGYHGGVFLTGGGFYSLDTFFALSGFLITSLLVREWQQAGTIRLGRFWARRARRLLPALLLMLLAVLAYATWIAPPDMYPGLRGDSLSTLFYVANWHFIVTGSNYFTLTGPTSLLLHTWSLAVEEQFYLVWPLVVLLILRSRLGLRFLLGVCVSGALGSAVLMAVLYSPSTQNRVYYGTDTRAQSLLVGAALAVGLTLAAGRRGRPSGSSRAIAGPSAVAMRATNGRTKALFGIIGIVGVLASAVLWTTVTVDDAFAFRGGFLLAACSTACVLVSIVVSPTWIVAKFLAIAVLRFFGRISYGLYLWHFPLFIWVDHARTGLAGVAPRIAWRAGVETGPRRAGNRHRGRPCRVSPRSASASNPNADSVAFRSFLERRIAQRDVGRGHRLLVRLRRGGCQPPLMLAIAVA